MLLIPTTRPITSASGRRSSPAPASGRPGPKRRPVSATVGVRIPIVHGAFRIPSGCPTATSTSPTRSPRDRAPPRPAGHRRRCGATPDRGRRRAARPFQVAPSVAEHDLGLRPARDVRVRHDRAVAGPDHARACALAPQPHRTVLAHKRLRSAHPRSFDRCLHGLPKGLGTRAPGVPRDGRTVARSVRRTAAQHVDAESPPRRSPRRAARARRRRPRRRAAKGGDDVADGQAAALRRTPGETPSTIAPPSTPCSATPRYPRGIRPPRAGSCRRRVGSSKPARSVIAAARAHRC